MMKIRNYILSLLCCIIALPSFGQSTVIETRTLGAFSSILASGSFKIMYIKSDECSVKTEAKQGISKHVGTGVKNGVLVIDNKLGATYEDIVIYVTAPKLNEISISEAINFIGDQLENDKEIKINTFGGSVMRVGRIAADTVIFKSSGSSSVDINELTAKACEINIAGSSEMKIELETETISLICRGNSDVKLKGETDSISIDNRGGSDININELAYETKEEKP